MRKMVLEKGGEGTNPVVIATCRNGEEMCTLYAPLVQTKDFMMGQVNSETYRQGLSSESFIVNYKSLKQRLYQFSPSLVRGYIEKLF